jgi:hypothetical protein
MKTVAIFLITVLFSTSLLASDVWRINVIEGPELRHDIMYELAEREFKAADYGTSLEILEHLCKKTQEYPKAFYYLSRIYRNVKIYKDVAKYKDSLKTFAEHPSNNDEALKQQAYYELVCIESDPFIAYEYALMAQGIEKNNVAINAMKQAYLKMYKKTGTIRYERLKTEVVGKIQFTTQNTNFVKP